MKQLSDIREIMEKFKDWLKQEELGCREAYLEFNIDFMGHEVMLRVEFEDDDWSAVEIYGIDIDNILTEEIREGGYADDEDLYRKIPLEEFMREISKSARICTVKDYCVFNLNDYKKYKI